MGLTPAPSPADHPGPPDAGPPDVGRLLTRPGAGLLLDLDGTLVDSEPVHREAFRAYFAQRDWPVDDDVVAQFAGRRAHEVFAALDGPWRGEDPHRLTAGVVAALGTATAEPVLVPGAAQLLAACTRTGLAVAVVTSAHRRWAADVVRRLGVDPDALPMVTADECRHGKPDPEPYRRGAQRLGLDPAGLVAAEDTPAGIASARAAGVGRVLGLTTTLAADRLRDAGAHVTAPDLRALARAVTARG
ncbi:HAD family phosphatase [uncultured Cellulomonas sp.]|uniref:HAD family hydrolase n=1 Tax=uncultured Cellulomonas sp. TaxID=189682 RepID=UPI0026109FF1|nr:HAD-IA family hydrolase [uncultured Cellulomonas sp.]